MTTRLAFCGNLHDLSTNGPELAQLVDRVVSSQAEVLILTGNIGQPLDRMDSILTAFEAFDGSRGIVIGNRDLWQLEVEARSSKQLWEETFSILFRRHGFTWLEQRNIVTDGLGICGTIAWYDYSARDVALGYSVRQYENLKGLTNEDAHFITWDLSDVDFSAIVHDKFTARIDALEHDRSVERVVAVTHFPVFLEQIPDRLTKRERFDLAYHYNLAVGRTILPKNKLTCVVSGHHDAASDSQMQFGNNTIQTYILGNANTESMPLIIDV